MGAYSAALRPPCRGCCGAVTTQVTAEYHFIVKADVASTLSWSGNSSALLLETLASMDPTSAQACIWTLMH
jgi:hypothetical protein